jgi:hypothetical protein
VNQSEFGLQHDLPGAGISNAWRTIVANQARALEGILRRLRDAAVLTQRLTGDPQRQYAVFRELAAEAEQFFAEEAWQNVELEQDIAAFKREFHHRLEFSSEATRRLRAMEQVNETLHANLAAARRILENMVKDTGKTPD